MNWFGPTSPRRGHLPAQQRLAADDAVVLDLNDWLEEQLELLLLQCHLELRPQLQALARTGVHIRLEHRVTAFAVAFGHVHREVRVPQEMLRARASVGQRDPDTGAERHALACEQHRAAQRGRDPISQVDDRVRIFTLLHQHAELVTAEPRDHDRLNGELLEPLGDQFQRGVTGFVAEHIVDRLEVVEVHEQDREQCVATTGGVSVGRAQAFEEHAAVGQSGELVVQPLVRVRMCHLGEQIGDHDRAETPILVIDHDVVIAAVQRSRLDLARGVER